MVPALAASAETAFLRPRAPEVPRDRLLDRLEQAATRRLVLVTAGPGFGKSALLADFCRRTPHPSPGIRLGSRHRDPQAFAQSIVAALGVEISDLPAEPTASCLRALGSVPGGRAFLVLDDFHHVDDVPEIRAIVHDLLAEAPDGVGLIIGSRRRPSLSVARVRASGDLVEIGPEQLHFDRDEAARLFGNLGAHVPHEVVDAIRTHTGGWPAALRLIEAAIRERHGVDDAVRRCPVRAIDAARRDLDAYIAEEVIGPVAEPLRWFLLRTSVLDEVRLELAAAAAGMTTDEAQASLDAASVAGLVWDGGPGATGHRYRPVVREYLDAELRRAIGEVGAAVIHRTVAVAARETDWRTATRHAARARDERLVGEVIVGSLDLIVDRGEAGDALAALSEAAGTVPPGVIELLESRAQFGAGRLDRAVELARAALESGATAPPEVAAVVLSSLRAIERVATCRDGTAIVGEERDLREESDRLEDAYRLAPPSPSYRRGLTLLGLALVSFARGLLRIAVERSDAAADELRRAGSPREVGLALSLAAWSLAHDGHWEEARARIGEAVRSVDGDRQILEAAVSLARAYGDPGDATPFEADLSALDADSGLDDAAPSLAEAIAAIAGVPAVAAAAQNTKAALEIASRAAAATDSAGTDPAGQVRPGSDRAGLGAAERALAHAVRIGARLCADLDRVLIGLARGGKLLSEAVSAASTGDGAPLVILAPTLVRHLGELDAEASAAIAVHIAARPERWRDALRSAIDHGTIASRLAAGRALVAIGAADDVTPLHHLARSTRARGTDATLARQLARRLAPPVMFDDLGRVAFSVGNVRHPGTMMRRKVLALVCFLLTRPDLSATRDQVLDALWPELEPDVAANSLNQTIYFLRRTLDPSYVDERSADYVHHDSDVVWLDPDLVASRSRSCRDLIRRCRPIASIADVDALAEAYTERFALDFAYEPWAEPYRESLHAAYLEVVERAIEEAASNGAFDRAIALARRVLEIDPGAEQVELTLLRLYRRTGALAAAAEQYGHYASVLREELGVEPPPLESI